MSIKIDHFRIQKGESMFVECEGSVEKSLFIRVAEDGTFTVAGPANCNSREFVIDTAGLNERRPIRSWKMKRSKNR